MNTIGSMLADVSRWTAGRQNLRRRDIAGLVRELALARSKELAELVAGFGDRRRYPERPQILVGGAHDGEPTVWLLGWREGDWTPIHDHVESEAAILVLAGEVTERAYWPRVSTVLPAHGPDDVIERELHAGGLITVPTPYIHAMGTNLPGALAASLHAYWPPLHHMDYYQQEDGLLAAHGGWNEAPPPPPPECPLPICR